MEPKATVKGENDAWSRLYCTDGDMFESIREAMVFEAPGARHMPLVKAGKWDGKIRLLSKDGAFHTGLAGRIGTMAAERGADVSYEDLPAQSPVTMEFVEEYIGTLDLPFEPRDYQIEGVYRALHDRRCLLVSPTASGKSLVIYIVTRFLADQGIQTLVIVPAVSLVKQMQGDFADYGAPEGFSEGIMGGVDKSALSAPVTVSTWQSVYKEDAEFFRRWKAVVGDEVHGFKAKSLIDIMSKLTRCPLRVGVTATLNKEEVHRLTLEGLFGDVRVLTTSKELMDRGDIAGLQVVPVVVRYCDNDRAAVKGTPYQHEIKFITQNPERWEFVAEMAMHLSGNTIILFQFVGKHGVPLHAILERKLENTRRPLYFFHGGVKVEEREDFRRMMEGDRNAVAVASYGTFSQGVNVKAINNVIFASPYKSYIKVVQSIGRGLRLAKGKKNMVLYDVIDDLCSVTGKSRNYAWKHWKVRLETYRDEKFPVSEEMEYPLPEASFFIE